MKAEPPGAARLPGFDPPTKQRWSHEEERGRDGFSVGVAVPGWESVSGRTAWPQARVSARSASQRPAASRPARSGCKPPGRSRHGRGRGQRWTCLEEHRKTYSHLEEATVSNICTCRSVLATDVLVAAVLLVLCSLLHGDAVSRGSLTRLFADSGFVSLTTKVRVCDVSNILNVWRVFPRTMVKVALW